MSDCEEVVEERDTVIFFVIIILYCNCMMFGYIQQKKNYDGESTFFNDILKQKRSTRFDCYIFVNYYDRFDILKYAHT